MDRRARLISPMGSLGNRSCESCGGIAGPRVFRLEVTNPPPRKPMNPILSHVLRRKGLNSMVLTRVNAGPKASMAERRFIGPRFAFSGMIGELFQPRC